MPHKTLDAMESTPEDLFLKPIVYEIPYYQRAYVWDLPNQWQPLWEDIEKQAENYLKEEKHGDSRPIAHFMGALVLQETEIPNEKKSIVVDGQQRLITVQILLAATASAMQRKFNETTDNEQRENYKELAQKIRNLIKNGKEYMRSVKTTLKVSPSKADKKAFEIVMGKSSTSARNHPLEQAYHWFLGQASNYLTANTSANPDLHAEALEWATTQGIQFVEINVKRDVDANEIFDSLNSRGTPLSTADQAKNFMYWRVYREEKEDPTATEDRMRRVWPFDGNENLDNGNESQTQWWHQELKIRGLDKPLETFLHHWLILRCKAEVKTGKVLAEFKEQVKKYGIDSTGADLARNAVFYKNILAGKAEQNSFLFRWRHGLQTTTMLPVLLKLRQFPNQEQKAAEQYLESYGVRRWICQLNNAGQTNAMTALLQKLEEADSENASKVVKEFLKKQLERSRIWPDDQTVKNALREEPVLRSRNTNMVKMILLAIEQHLQSPKSEKRCYSWNELQIEHLWPQKWEKYWSKPSDPRLLEQIGNLTLVSEKLNPDREMSNRVWSKKKNALKDHSTLKLNEELLKHQGPWDETAIKDRNQGLAAMIVKIWPRSSV